MVERKKGATGLELERDGRSRGVLGVFYGEEREREREREREIGRSLMAGRGEGWATVRRERGGNKGRKEKKAMNINFE
jgi:hypothetical protein